MRDLRRRTRMSCEGLPEIGANTSASSFRSRVSSLGIMARKGRARQLVDALTR